MKFALLFLVLLLIGSCALFKSNTMRDCTDLCKRSNAQIFESEDTRCVCNPNKGVEP